MFVVEILSGQTSEGTDQKFFIQQPWLKISDDQDADLIINKFSEYPFDLIIYKKLGNTFKCEQRRKPGKELTEQEQANLLNETYEFNTKIFVAGVKLLITTIDADLMLREQEPPDLAGLRMLKQAAAGRIDPFPLIKYLRPYPAEISIAENQVLTAGRKGNHILKFQTDDVSSNHAKFSYQAGKFWVEDNGSTNGTYLDGKQISGRTYFEPGQVVTLGASAKLTGLLSDSYSELMEREEKKEATPEVSEKKKSLTEELTGFASEEQGPPTGPQVEQAAVTEAPEIASVVEATDVDQQQKFPVLITNNEIVKPAKLILRRQQWYIIGRDPSSDLWIGAPFVSRQHCKVRYHANGSVEVVDLSTNGTAYSAGIIHTEDEVFFQDQAETLHFGSGLTIAICFDQDSVDKFYETGGRADAFINGEVAVESEGAELAADILEEGEVRKTSSLTAAQLHAAHYKTDSFKALRQGIGATKPVAGEQGFGMLNQFNEVSLKRKALLFLLALFSLLFLAFVLVLIKNIIF